MDEAGVSYKGRTEIPGKANLRELAWFFLRLGTTAFGGPAAHIAMMEDEVVRRRQWVPREKFLDLWGAANLIPGPTSTEMAIFIGYLCQGWAGLLLAGVCFITPAMVIVIGFAWAYVRFGNLPQITWLLYGVKPVVIAIILQALWQLGRSAVKTKFLGALAIIAVVLNFLGINVLAVLFGIGLLSGLQRGYPGSLARPEGAAGYAAGSRSFSYRSLFRFGVILHEQGRVRFTTALSLLRQSRLPSLWERLCAPGFFAGRSRGALALAHGYTVIGRHCGGAGDSRSGLYYRHFHRLSVGRIAGRPDRHRRNLSPVICPGRSQQPSYPAITQIGRGRSLLDGVIVASLALMAVVTWSLGRDAVIDLPTGLAAIASAILLIRFRLNSLWLVLGGAIMGWLVYVITTYSG